MMNDAAKSFYFTKSNSFFAGVISLTKIEEKKENEESFGKKKVLRNFTCAIPLRIVFAVEINEFSGDV
jgi:hypothetical protein